MFDNLRRDRAAYKSEWYRRTGFWIIVVYRIGNWADSLPSVFLRVPAWTLYLFLKTILGFFVSNVFIWAGRRGCRIGSGFHFVHAENIMIGRGVVIGDNCSIYHEVTLGTGQIPGTPTLGNRVVVYPGARILGGVVIGDDVMVGANCVVTRDVPKHSAILSAPSRVIPQTLSTQARRWDEERKPLPPLNPQSFQ